MRGILLSFLLLSMQVCFAQEGKIHTIDISRAEACILELYADCPQYQNQDQIAYAQGILKRIRIHEIPLNQYPECPLLSSVDLIDKCNTTSQRTYAQFDPNSFNPMLHRMKVHSEQTEYYRVDGHAFIIEIQPAN